MRGVTGERLTMRGRIATLVVLMWCVTLVGCGSSARRSTDPDFILRVNSMSPNGELRLLEYQYDIGALGYSRTWWAVTRAPISYWYSRSLSSPFGDIELTLRMK